jgi:hypothetical protein
VHQKAFIDPGSTITAKEIAAKYFNNRRTPRWVHKHVCPKKRLEYTSATKVWLEAHVVEWLQHPYR